MDMVVLTGCILEFSCSMSVVAVSEDSLCGKFHVTSSSASMLGCWLCVQAKFCNRLDVLILLYAG